MGEEVNRKNLPRSPPRLPPTNNLFGSLPQFHVAHTTGEVERAERLVDVILNGRDAAEHERLAILRDGILQEMRQCTVSKGNVLLVRPARGDHVT